MASVLFGLTCQSGNDAIQDMVFDKAHKARYFSLSTLPVSGKEPSSRVLDFMRCQDDGLIYFGVGQGKPCNEELTHNPVVTLSGSFADEEEEPSTHSLMAFRITGRVREANNPRALEEYWERNSRFQQMWEKRPKDFIVYCLHQGEGELYQMYRNDAIYRLRFGFGGVAPRPFRYSIDTKICKGCGVCSKACTADILIIRDGKAIIPFHHCYECGVCRASCPHGAVFKIDRDAV